MSIADQGTERARATRRVPLTVRFSPGFINALPQEKAPPLKAATAAPSFKTAFLFGTVKDAAVIVQAFRPFEQARADSDGESSGFSQGSNSGKLLLEAKADSSLSPLNLIGWCSVQVKGGAPENEVEFYNRHFRRASDIALLLTPAANSEWKGELYTKCSAGSLSGGNCCWTPLHFSSENAATVSVELSPRLQMDESLYLKAYESANAPGQKSRINRSKKRATSTLARKVETSKAQSEPPASVTSEPPLIPVSKPPVRPASESSIAGHRTYGPLFWLLALAILFVCVAGAVIYLALPHPSLWGAPSRPTAQVMLNPALELHVAGEDDRLVLNWDSSNPVVRSANDAVLQIDDGGKHREIHLNSDQLSGGAIIYKPASPDVTFRLDLRDKRGKGVSASIRSLDGTITPPTPSLLHSIDSKPALDKPAALNKLPLTSTSPAVPAPRHSSANVERPKALPNVPQEPKPNKNLMLSAMTPPKLTTEPQPVLASLNPPAKPVEQSSSLNPSAPSEQVQQPITPAILHPPGETSSPGPQPSAFFTAYKPPRPLRKAVPRVVAPGPGQHKNVSVEVTVNIDADGRVIATRVSQDAAHASGPMISAAVAAARHWQFEPATLHGKDIPSEYSIVFQFHP